MREKPNIRKAIKISQPYLSKLIKKGVQECGAIEIRSFDPSSGGIGIRLKTAKSRFICTIQLEKTSNDGLRKEPKNLIRRPKNKAKIKFAIGPAKATKPISLLGFLKSKGLKGTGFAQPKTKAPLVLT